MTELLNFFYPVGTIYHTTSTDLDTTTKMGNYFGGTWEVYGSGQVLVAKSADTEFDTIGETGGSKTHTISAAELPTAVVGIGTPIAAYGSATSSGFGMKQIGSGSAHNNLQPYIVVYRYRRTA